jgi:flavin reductase (DIM6/NTAB) family NADH-FMN oxidoreductase RutF
MKEGVSVQNRKPLDIKQLNLQPFTTMGPQGVLLVSGSDTQNANPMTISWGTFGIMWNKPVVMVMVRHTRHTWEYISKMPDFTLNWLDKSMSKALALCGRVSGRDMDKFTASGLHTESAAVVGSPIIAESILNLECRIIYHDMVKPDQFKDISLSNHYAANDYHGLFYGEVVAAAGIEKFILSQ